MNESGASREVPWFQVGIAAGVGLLGVIVMLAVVAPLVVLGGLLWLGLVGWLGYVLGRRAWTTTTTSPRVAPGTRTLVDEAERRRADARERHARTQEVVAARLVPPGFVRPE